MNPLRGIVIFTIIETIVMVAWLAFALAGHFILSVVVLLVGLFAEHLAAYNVGAGRPLFSVPRPASPPSPPPPPRV